MGLIELIFEDIVLFEMNTGGMIITVAGLLFAATMLYRNIIKQY